MFKKFTSVLFLLITFNAYSQISINKTTLLATGQANNDFPDLAGYNKIYNIGNSPDTISWVRTKNELGHIDWTSAVCDIIQCHSSEVDTYSFILPAGDSGSLSFHFYPKDKPGFGHMTVNFTAKSDPSTTIQVDIYSHAWGLSTTQVSKFSNLVYPNPTNGILNFSNSVNENSQISIYNLNGQLVKEISSFDAKNNIDISEFNSGVYSFVINTNGKIETGKFLVD